MEITSQKMAKEIGGQHVLQLGEDDFNTHVNLEAIRHSHHNLHFQFNKMDSRAAKNELKKLNTHKAMGWNVISNKILKPMAVSLARSLTKLVNTCIQSGKRQSTWKRGVWIPVFKKKDRADFNLHRRKMSTHALEKMTRDLFRAMSWAPRQKCTGNMIKMLLRWKKRWQLFFGSDSVAISCHCKRSKIILVKVLT